MCWCLVAGVLKKNVGAPGGCVEAFLHIPLLLMTDTDDVSTNANFGLELNNF